MPLIDRTKLSALLGNLMPTFTSDSKKMKESLLVVHDTLDANYNEYTDHKASVYTKTETDSVIAEAFSDGVPQAVIDQITQSATNVVSNLAGAGRTIETVKGVNDDLVAHKADEVKHIFTAERTAWNAKETTTGAQTKATTAENNAKAASLPITGGALTGPATANSNTSYTTKQLRNITLSTANPTGGANGDIWIKYV